jgi:hypothetical protein
VRRIGAPDAAKKMHPKRGVHLFLLIERWKTLTTELLFGLVFAFGARSGMFHSLLGLGFVHGSLGFGSTLGSGFATLLTLFVQQFLAAEKFYESVVGAIAFAPSGADDAQVAPVTITEARADRVKQLVHGSAGHHVSKRLTTSRKIPAFAKCNHFLDQRTHGFRLGDRGLDSFFENERCD